MAAGGPREGLPVEASVQGTRAKEGSESRQGLGEGRGRRVRGDGDSEAGTVLGR